MPPICLVSEAAEYAARRHMGMMRKGRGNEPYINHFAEVANLLAIATGGRNAELIAAGWLHDVIEDTPTTQEELAQKFGDRVADLVAEVTDDMRLPKETRRQLQIMETPAKSPGAKLIKIADKISNVRARIFPKASQAQRDELADYVVWAEQVVASCRAGNATLDAMFGEAVADARSTL